MNDVHDINDMNDVHDMNQPPLRRQETKLDSQTLERVKKRIMTGNKRKERSPQPPREQVKQQKSMRVYRRPRDDSDEYASLAQKVNAESQPNGGLTGGDSEEDSLGTDSEEE